MGDKTKRLFAPLFADRFEDRPMMTIKKLLLPLLSAVLLLAAPAYASTEAESYVGDRANRVIETLNDPELDRSQRTAQFNTYMDEFTDMRVIARIALGSYARTFSADEFETYSIAFRDYALAVYEGQLDAYRGERVEVVGSTERPGGIVEVETRIIGAAAANGDLPVKWRVVERGGRWKVFDVEVFGLWLGVEQKAQFESILDRSNGDIGPLLERIQSMTVSLRSQADQRG